MIASVVYVLPTDSDLVPVMLSKRPVCARYAALRALYIALPREIFLFFIFLYLFIFMYGAKVILYLVVSVLTKLNGGDRLFRTFVVL